MSRVGQMSFVEAVAIILPAMRGVGAAHAHGVIHRDLKPDNIFLCLDADGSIRDCKVLDFGVSKLTVADAATTGDITLSGNVVGTPEYMAPEQVRSGKGADHRIDIYSLGVVFYEMLAGRPPFVGEHFSGLMLDIMQRDPPPLVSFRTMCRAASASVIHRALERDLEKRYLDMQGFIVAPREALGRDELKLAMETPPEGLVTQAGAAAADAARVHGAQVAAAQRRRRRRSAASRWACRRPASAGRRPAVPDGARRRSRFRRRWRRSARRPVPRTRGGRPRRRSRRARLVKHPARAEQAAPAEDGCRRAREAFERASAMSATRSARRSRSAERRSGRAAAPLRRCLSV
jgi:hypothetical protein